VNTGVSAIALGAGQSRTGGADHDAGQRLYRGPHGAGRAAIWVRVGALGPRSVT
jgi:hypothetical protein